MYLEVNSVVLVAQTRQNGAAFGATGRAVVMLGDRVDGADAGVSLEKEVAVGGQIGQGDIGESGEHALALRSSLEVTVCIQLNTFN